jgi:hypothetical protein
MNGLYCSLNLNYLLGDKMKKILIAITLLGLSSTAFAASNDTAKSACNDFKSAVNANMDQGNMAGFFGNMTNYTTSSGKSDTSALNALSSYNQGNYSAVATYCNSTFNTGVDTTKIPTGSTGSNASKDDVAKETQDRKDADQKIVDDQIKVDDAQNVEIGKKADQSALDQEVQDRKDGDKDLSDKIDKNKTDQAETDSNQDKVIATKASKEELASESTARQKADTVLSSRIDNNDSTLVEHDQRITSNTQRIGSVEGRVSNLEQSTNKRFADVDKRIGDNRKVASAGIAGAGAMANIPQVTQNGNVSIGAGIGGYDGEQAVAVGFSARVTDSVTTKVSVSTNTQSEVLWGAGVGVEW